METDEKPAAESGANAEAAGTGTSGLNAAFPTGLRVMVVDDDPLCLKVVEQMLKRCTYHVHTCNNAASALELLRDKRHGFDLVLSDVYMPGARCSLGAARERGMRFACSMRWVACSMRHAASMSLPCTVDFAVLSACTVKSAMQQQPQQQQQQQHQRQQQADWGINAHNPTPTPAQSQTWTDLNCWRRWGLSWTSLSSVSAGSAHGAATVVVQRAP